MSVGLTAPETGTGLTENDVDAAAKVFFRHRHNREGWWDSICLKCYLTVETASREDDLAEVERRHDCDALIAERMGYGAREWGWDLDSRAERRRM